MSLPDASTKLRLVLDYLPCEACLAQPVDDQELLCSICARLDREVAVRVGTRTTILLDRPAAPPAPIVIPPAPVATEPVAPPAPLPEVVVRFAEEPALERAGIIEVVVEPLAPPPPLVPTPLPAEAEVPIESDPDEFAVDDIATFTKARDEFFDYRKHPQAQAPAPSPTPQPEPEPEPAYAPMQEELAQDDFVFRPPEREEPVREPEPAIVDDIIPEEEVRVEAPPEEERRWAPPPDLLAEEAEEESIVEKQPVAEPEPAPEEEEILEMEPVPPEEDVVELEMLPDEPEPAPASAPAQGPKGTGDLYRLRGFDPGAESALAKARISEIAHLSGHDAGELQQRTGLPSAKLQAWIQVADLVQEVGVPVDAAVALVAAGVAGPKGLRDADPDEIADRVAAFGGFTVSGRDVKRWKRRA